MAAAMKKINIWAVSVAVVITILAVWLGFRAVDWQTVRKTFAQANCFWVALALANSLFGVYATGWRWRILLGPREKIPMSSLFRPQPGTGNRFPGIRARRAGFFALGRFRFPARAAEELK